MPPESILVIEDEVEIADLLQFHLKRSGYRAVVSHSGRKGLEMARSAPPALMLLDLMLPDLDGLEVCRRLRADKATAELPIIMLTAKGTESDIIAGLELGADDYITKPFSPRVLVARVKSILRRNATSETGADAPMQLLDSRLRIDPARHVVLVDSAPIELTVTEFELLRYLALRPGFVRTRDQIIAAVHGRNTVLSSRTVDVHITAVRKKLGALGDAIETVRGVGYRFSESMPV